VVEGRREGEEEEEEEMAREIRWARGWRWVGGEGRGRDGTLGGGLGDELGLGGAGGGGGAYATGCWAVASREKGE
jgi:hypothetical protein